MCYNPHKIEWKTWGDEGGGRGDSAGVAAGRVVEGSGCEGWYDKIKKFIWLNFAGGRVE